METRLKHFLIKTTPSFYYARWPGGHPREAVNATSLFVFVVKNRDVGFFHTSHSYGYNYTIRFIVPILLY